MVKTNPDYRKPLEHSRTQPHEQLKGRAMRRPKSPNQSERFCSNVSSRAGKKIRRVEAILMNRFQRQVDLILDNLEQLHNDDARYPTRRDGLLDAHLMALKTGRAPEFKNHVECVYDVVRAWGMDTQAEKNNPKRPKMVDIEIFTESVSRLKHIVIDLQMKNLCDLVPTDWTMIESLFKDINVMQTRRHLVGHSKVLAHLIPDIVSPVDQNNTLAYLDLTHPIGLIKEWQMFRDIHVGFVIPVAASLDFQIEAQKWIADGEFPWDTSVPKIIDNLVFAANRRRRDGLYLTIRPQK